MAIIGWSIAFLLSIWLVGSLFICGYWFFNPADQFWAEHRYISTVIGIGAFLACCLVVMMGIEQLLWFIPENWVYETEGGELRVARYSIAALIGLIAACFLGFLFDKVERMRRANLNLNTELVITREIERRRKEELDFFEEKYVKEAAAEFRQRLEKLEELAATDSLRPTQEVERRVLLGLLNELEWRLESLSELENGDDEQKQ